MTRSLDEQLDRAGALLRQSRSIAVLSGAGISAESGLDTFRDPGDGLWAKYDPMELATPQAFAKDPELVSRWYDWRRCRCLEAKPNAGHAALVDLERCCAESHRTFTLITQNVDRLHHAAGSTRAVELHGNLHEWRCTGCGACVTPPGSPFDTYPLMCACGHPLRPCVIWFGESLDPRAIAASTDAAASCDVLLVIGTSAAVYPAAGLIDLAAQSGASTIEVNPGSTQASERVDVALRGPGASMLPRLVAHLDDRSR